MSVSVYIKQNPVTKRKIDSKYIKGLTNAEKLHFGVFNQAHCYREYTGGEDIRNQALILFNQSRYGRGFILRIDDDYNLELTLNIPSTQNDINDFYLFIKLFCIAFKIKTIWQEGIEYKTDQIDELKQDVEIVNKENLHDVNEGLTIFGCIYPIVLEKEFIDQIQILNEEQSLRYFGSYLDKKQKLDCYYAVPLVYEKNNGKYFVSYALTENVPSILPLKPYLPFGYNQSLKEIDEWKVAILEDRDNALKLSIEIPFDDFYKLLDPKKLVKFDAKNIIIIVNKDLFRSIEDYKIKKYKKDLEEWLEDIRELGHKPFKIEYTNNFKDEKGIKCYIFKYKKSMLSKWFLGIVSDIGAFSKINVEYRKDTEITDAKSTLKLLSEIREKYNK